MSIRGHLIAIALLAALTAGLAQAARHLWTTPLTPAPPSAALGGPVLQLPERLEAGLPAPSSLALAHILERPLFSPTRRPPVPEPQPAPEPLPPTRVVTFMEQAPEPSPPPASNWQDLRLIGVLQADERRRALVTTPEDPEGSWLAEGENVLGWRIVSIAPNKVEVVFGEERHTLSLQIGD